VIFNYTKSRTTNLSRSSAFNTAYPYVAFNFTNCCKWPITTIEHKEIDWQVVKPCPTHPVWCIYMFCIQNTKLPSLTTAAMNSKIYVTTCNHFKFIIRWKFLHNLPCHMPWPKFLWHECWHVWSCLL